LLFLCFGVQVAFGEIPFPNPIHHVIVIVQENRTPDNLFHGLLTWPGINPANYDIASRGVNSKGEVIPLEPIPLGISYDLSHAHAAFVAMYNHGKMDGADRVPCSGKCAGNPQFKYVDNSQHAVDPYLTLAAEYGWANYMFQTNQGPSYPAHQFIFGGTSARSESEDHAGIYVAENPAAPNGSKYLAQNNTGCLAPLNEWNYLLYPDGVEKELTNNPLGTLCFSHGTMGSLLEARGLTWKYYAPATANPNNSNPGGLFWVAPNSIREICEPNESYTECLGRSWATSVDLKPTDVLTDIGSCQLDNVSWVIPAGQNSDHAGNPIATGGPSWVASIVNAIGSDTKCEGGAGYWSDTAIVITWDDWGGWYDHVTPRVLFGSLGSYQYGFRVPLLVVSAYTPRAYVDNMHHDFGSIQRFIEAAFGIPEGSLGLADARSAGDLSGFFKFEQSPREFRSIKAPLDANFFIHDTKPPEPPDTD
jgi:phospholipase C